MRKIILFSYIALIALTMKAQTVIHTEDVTHFWQAFDSIQTTNDEEKKIFFLQQYYLNQGSEGLKYTIKPRYLEGNNTYKAKDWFKYISENKEKIQRIRTYTLNNLEEQKKILQSKFKYFKKLYSPFERMDVYFVIGLDEFGGTVDGKKVIIGCEVMAKESPDWGVSIVLHEFVHTLQKLNNDVLLQHCIMEGTADFVAELVNQKSLAETYPGGYIDFGSKNEKAVWEEFKKYISSNEIDGKYFDWIYGSKGREINGTQMKDLGYFMGYAICKAYYKNAKDKEQALKEIIEWDLSTPEKARQFLLKSSYVPKKDLLFIQNFKFKPVNEINKKIKKELYGYRLTKDEVVFVYKLGKVEDEKVITKLTVAGIFNNWNPSDNNYKMILKENRTFELSLPKSVFEKNKTYTFKFVKNGEIWLAVPDKALNVDTESGNLTLKLN